MSYFKIIFIAILVTQLGCACEPEVQETEFHSIIYNQELIEKHLVELPQSNYPEETKDLQQALVEALEISKERQLEIINVWTQKGIRPPAPCPGPRTSDPHCWPEDLIFTNVIKGVYSQLAAESDMKWIDKDSKEIVAKGVFYEYDEKRSIAWFQFEVVNADLVSNALQLQVSTLIKDGEDFSTVKLEEGVPANTFTMKK